jgi:hypothetical protein
MIGAPVMSFRFELVRFRFAKMCAWYNDITKSARSCYAQPPTGKALADFLRLDGHTRLLQKCCKIY